MSWSQEYQKAAAGLPMGDASRLTGILRDLWPLAQMLLQHGTTPAALPQPPYSDPGLTPDNGNRLNLPWHLPAIFVPPTISVPPLRDPGMSAAAPGTPGPGAAPPPAPAPLDPGFTPRPGPSLLPPLDRGMTPPASPLPMPPLDPGFSPAPGAGTVYGPHAAYPGASPGIPDLRKPNPLVLLGTTLLGALMGGGTGGALAGLGGGAAGYNQYRQQLVQAQQAQQQLDTQAASQQAQQEFYRAQAHQAQIDALDRQIAQDDEFFRDPERIIRNGLAEPELLQAAVTEANLRRHQRGYTGTDLSYQAIARNVADFRRKYPEMYGGAGWQWNAETQRYERTPVPPGVGGLRPGERPVTPEQYQQRGPMGPPVPANYIDPTAVRPGNPDYTGMPPGWHPPMAVPQGDAGAPPPGAPAGAPPPGSPADAPPTGPAFLGANPAASAGAPGAATVAGPTQIRVPGIAAPITIPESMYAAAGFNPQTMEANLLQAGFAPEHATAMAASQQAGLIERAKQDMGIAQLPMSLQQAALGMAATRADVELKYAQAVHERNQPLMDLYQARLKEVDQQQHQAELEQTGSHNLSQQQQTELAHYQDAIKAKEGSRQSTLQSTLALLDNAKADAFEATDKRVPSNTDTTSRSLGIGQTVGTLVGISTLPSILKWAGARIIDAGKKGVFAGMTRAAAMAEAGEGATVTGRELAGIGGAEALSMLVREMGGPFGVAALAAAAGGLSYLATFRQSDGKLVHVVTTEGRHLLLEDPATQRYLQLQVRADAMSGPPPRPIPNSYEEMLLDKRPTSKQEIATARAMVLSPGKKDRSGNVIPNLQDAYYATQAVAGDVAAYRLIRGFTGAFPNLPIPIRIGQPQSPTAPPRQDLYGSSPFVQNPRKPAVNPGTQPPPGAPKNAAEAAKRMIQAGPQSPFGSGRGLLPWARGQGEGLFVYPP